jgi:hypothetical protein
MFQNAYMRKLGGTIHASTAFYSETVSRPVSFNPFVNPLAQLRHFLTQRLCPLALQRADRRRGRGLVKVRVRVKGRGLGLGLGWVRVSG